MKRLTSIILLAGMITMLAGVAFADPAYTVAVNPIANGFVSVNTSSSVSGATVTITAVPSEGYALALLTVVDASGTAVTYNTLSEAAYTFTMPAANVTVSATFVTSGGGSMTTAAFKDVAKADWFYDAVAYVSDKELMTGINGSFNPQGVMTRGMVVTILYRLAGSPGLVGQPGFSDVAPSDAYARPVLWASQNGITNGYSNNAFGVNDPVSREQLVAFLCRYAKLRNCDVTASADLSKFSDLSTVDGYALPAMKWAVAHGIVQGNGSSLVPLSGTTRAQGAAIFMRFCKTLVK